MARLSNAASLAERKALHAAKMAGKKYDAARRFLQPTVTQKAIERLGEGGLAKLMGVSRNTYEPHANAREIARRQRHEETN